jgi:HK97 family phage portal protein
MSFLRTLIERFYPEVKSNPVGMVDVGWKAGKPQRMPDDFKSYSEEGFAKCAIVKAAIEKVAKAVAHVPLKIMHLDSDGDGFDEEVVDRHHPLKQIMHKPNPVTNGFDFWEAYISWYCLWGNAYLIGDSGDKNTSRPPVELWQMPPNCIEIIPAPDGTPATYRFKRDGKQVDFKVNFVDGRSSVLHFRTFNPLNNLYGMPIMRAAAMQVDQHNSAAEWNMSVLQNSGRPPGGFTYEPAGNVGAILTREQREQLERDIDERMTGPKNARRPFILDGGLKWNDMSMSAVDLDWLEGQRDAARIIALAYGVPSQLLGIPGDNTYANYEQARLALYEDTVLPLLDRLLDNLNEWLVPAFDPELRLVPDVDRIAALAPRRTEKWTQIAGAQHMTINEKRTALDMEPLDDPAADEVWIPSTLVPLSMSVEKQQVALDVAQNPPAKPVPPGQEKPPGKDEAPPTKSEIALAVEVKKALHNLTYGKG